MSFFSVEKKYVWLACLFPLLFASDILYGILDYYGYLLVITPGMVLRGGLLMAALFILIRQYKVLDKWLWTWLLVLCCAVIPSIIVGAFNSQSLFFDINGIFRVLYLPIVTFLVVLLIAVYRITPDEILRFIEYSAYMLGLSLLLSQELGIQRHTYGEWGFGSTGVFYAQNDMTLAFGLSLLAAGYRLVVVRFSWLRLVLLSASAFACLQIGTRASLAVVIGTALTTIACTLWGKSASDKSGFIRRLKIYFLGFLLLATMSSMLIYGLSKQQEHYYQQRKLEQVAQGEHPRMALLEAGALHIENRSIIYDLFGEGRDAYQRGVANNFPVARGERRLVEVDWMDIYGTYGVGFTLLIHLFVLYPFAASTFKFIFHRDQLFGLLASAILLYLGHGVLAGHALTSPIPSTLIAGYLAIYISKRVAMPGSRFVTIVRKNSIASL